MGISLLKTTHISLSYVVHYPADSLCMISMTKVWITGDGLQWTFCENRKYTSLMRIPLHSGREEGGCQPPRASKPSVPGHRDYSSLSCLSHGCYYGPSACDHRGNPRWPGYPGMDSYLAPTHEISLSLPVMSVLLDILVPTNSLTLPPPLVPSSLLAPSSPLVLCRW